MKRKIAVFLSGSGTNAKNICSYFKGHPAIEVALLVSNKEQSGAKAIGESFHIPTVFFNKESFHQPDVVLQSLQKYRIDAIVLAGFLWMIPDILLREYPNRIINIHPALLPKYGGKGMHGRHVHEMVFNNKEKESGITIHLCNERYDEGKILFQQKVDLAETDTPETIARKVQELEHQYYPKMIESYLLNADLT
ncbi:MAG: phosphoribosylglycinamide formyltransferase [Chitinophagales bacterium]